jgi:hypothetical protein
MADHRETKNCDARATRGDDSTPIANPVATVPVSVQ